MDIELVIMDWAGTTVDYGCFAPVYAFEKAFKEVGIVPTMEEIREPMGMLKKDHIRTMLAMRRIHELWLAQNGKEPDEPDVERIYDIFEKKLMEGLAEYTDPKEGCLECMDKLREHGIRIGSTTGYTHAMMDVVEKEAAAKGYHPDLLVTPEDVDGNGRPKPYMIFRNMQLLQAEDIRKVMKVGDTASDMKEGKNAGVYTVGVLEGSSALGMSQEEFEGLTGQEQQKELDRAKKILMGAGADRVIRSLKELPHIIFS
jgi:phosphonoacetaldehyde hydrolase